MNTRRIRRRLLANTACFLLGAALLIGSGCVYVAPSSGDTDVPGDRGGDTGITEVPGDPDGDAAALVPEIAYVPDFEKFSTEGPGLGGSTRDAAVLLRKGTTIGELNAFLARESAAIIGSSPGDEVIEEALLIVRFPTTSALELLDLTARIQDDPIVEIAAPDIIVAPDSIPSSVGSAQNIGKDLWCNDVQNLSSDWSWDAPDAPAGGNWGLEDSRVPQMWNWNGAIEKSGARNLITGIVDGGLPEHADVETWGDGLGLADRPDHGLHVAGIIGATHNNGQGIDGVNPFGELVGAWWGGSMFTSIDATRHLLKDFSAKVVSISIGFRWYEQFQEDPGSFDPLVAREYAHATGALADKLALERPETLFVVSSGNDHGWVDAKYGSAWAYAGLVLGSDNVLVVASHGPAGARSAFSNPGAEILAPGEQILSTVTCGYGVGDGTSMAVPFVAGVASYLLALDPTLEPHELKTVIKRPPPPAGGSTNDARSGGVSAFASVLEIDQLPDHTGDEMLRKLLDISDGSRDGNQRVTLLPGSPEVDRSFEKIEGPNITEEDLDGDGGIGDGKVDMADFRRWRDWLYVGQGHGPLHRKNDANGDGDVDAATETVRYPRGDWNGDGFLDPTRPEAVAGQFKYIELSDLEVLQASGLWDDNSMYTDVSELSGLVDSVDVYVSAESFFERYDDVDELEIAPYDLATQTPIDNWWTARRVRLDESQPDELITVPAGATIYIASDKVKLDDDTEIMARSIGEAALTRANRGEDLVVDLVRIDLTAIAETENPELEKIDSDPTKKEVEAAIAATLSASGCQAFANDEGTFHALARSGDIGVPPIDPLEPTTFESRVRWQRSFVKQPGKPDPEFEVKPMQLRLQSAYGDKDYEATAEIVVEVRAYDVSPDWEEVFSWQAAIAGRLLADGDNNYRIVSQSGSSTSADGGLSPIQLTPLDSDGVEYVQEEYPGKIDLSAVPEGHSFEVRYSLSARAFALLGDSLAEAYIADPLHYGGVRMNYGSFGELPRIDSFTFDAAGAVVSFMAKEGFYWILYRDGVPVAVAVTEEGPSDLVDPDAPDGATVDSYDLENQPLDQPLDLDGDGIDDLYELAHAEILDPLDPGDARLDPDGDGRSTLLEYQEGTDPTVADEAPETPADIFPARVFDPGVDDATIADVNGDGIVDLVDVGASSITVALGLAAGGFDVPLPSEAPDLGFLDESTFADLDGNGFLDVVTVDLLGDRVQVMLGDGLGGFTDGGAFGTGGSPQYVTSADVDGDGRVDVLTANDGGESISVLLGKGDGGFELAVDTEIDAEPLAVAAADMDGDGVPDLVVAVQQGALVSISPGNGDGTFGDPTDFQALGTLGQMTLADVDADGSLDVVATSASGDVVSVFLGNGDGTLQVRTDYPTGAGPDGLCPADLDADGDLDLVVGHQRDRYHAVFLGDGTGAFTPHDPAYTTSSGSCLLADFTRDGRLDLLSPVGPGYFISEGLPGGRFDTRAEVTVADMFATDLELADVDGDGWMDVVIPNGSNDSLEILIGSASGAFTHTTTIPVGEKISKSVSGHFDEGPTVGLAVITEALPSFPGSAPFPGSSANQLHVLLGDDAAGLVANAPIDLEQQPTDLLAGDIDGDGLDDVVTVFAGVRSFTPFINQGDGVLAGGELVALASLRSLRLGDVDGDGRADVVASTGESTVRVFLGTAAGELTEVGAASPAGTGAIDDIYLHDVTGDGVLDLVGSFFELGETRLAYLPGNGDGSFAAEQTLIERFTGDLSRLSMVDVDGDGRVDVSAGTEIRLGSDDGSFGAPQTYWSATQAVHDVDGDQRLDRLAATGDALEILIQR